MLQAWREALHLHPAAFLLRVAAKDTVLSCSGMSMPAGVLVGLLVTGAQQHVC